MGDKKNCTQKESDLDEAFRDHANKLADLLKKETFFRETAAIDQHSRELKKEYMRRFQEAAKARREAYMEAIQSLEKTPGWEKLNDEQKSVVKDPLAVYAADGDDTSAGIPQLRFDCDAATNRLNKAVEEMVRLVDGNRGDSRERGWLFLGRRGNRRTA